MPRKGKEGGFSGPLSSIAMAGIALGVVVMVMAISILDGFRKDITQKVSGFGSHITLTAYQPAATYTEEPVSLDSSLLHSVATLPGIGHMQAFATKGGMVKTDSQIYGIMLRGYGHDWDTTFFAGCLTEGLLPKKAADVLISTTVARKLGLKVGDKMRTYFWQGDSYRPRVFTVTGLYNTDLTEMDELYAIGTLATVQKLNDWDSAQVGGYELTVSDFNRLEEVAESVRQAVPYDMLTTTVRQAHPALFSWLDLLNANITLLLAIMALVSTVCIVSALLIMIFEKSSTIGLLKALGACNASVHRIFMLKASHIILCGIAIGDLVALALSLAQLWWHPLTLDPESYSMSVVPVLVEPGTYLFVSMGTLVLCLLALLIPISRVSHISPAETMRVEK